MQREMLRMENRFIYVDGKIIPWAKATVHIMCHSFARGSGIFEVISLHKTKTGRAIFRLDEHLDRLTSTADLLSMKIPISNEKIVEAIYETVKANDIYEGVIKIMAYYPQTAVDILPSAGSSLTMSIIVFKAGEIVGSIPVPFEEGISLCRSKWNKLDPRSVPVEAKVAANYLNGMMGALDAKERGFDRAIMFDMDGFIAESSTSSVFMIKSGELLTPEIGTILKSISRKSIIEIAKVYDIPVKEAKITYDSLIKADEIFMASTTGRVTPVVKFENINLPGARGPISQKLYYHMEKIQKGDDDRFACWLFEVK